MAYCRAKHATEAGASPAPAAIDEQDEQEQAPSIAEEPASDGTLADRLTDRPDTASETAVAARPVPKRRGKLGERDIDQVAAWTDEDYLANYLPLDHPDSQRRRREAERIVRARGVHLFFFLFCLFFSFHSMAEER